MLYWYNTWPSCWGNYSFALTLIFKTYFTEVSSAPCLTISPQGAAGVQGSRDESSGKGIEPRQFLK